MAITPFIPPSYLSSLPAGVWSGADGLPVLPFLPGQDIAVSKAPVWSTKVVRAASGRERRTAHWSFPLWKFELRYGVVRHRPTQAELMAMWEFFNVAQGQFGPWLFVDPTDCQLPTDLLLDANGRLPQVIVATGVQSRLGPGGVGAVVVLGPGFGPRSPTQRLARRSEGNRRQKLL